MGLREALRRELPDWEREANRTENYRWVWRTGFRLEIWWWLWLSLGVAVVGVGAVIALLIVHFD